ncbi:MAG: GIY-YIG nuclease family protein [Candidatus Harrisonbacteria bacterium]|nr:GIY-YIG nuclease family protein [Candidatus Harrisonbacteria bacterium]
MFWTYILQSLKDKKTYIGHTKDVRSRLKEHNSGNVMATKHRRPLKVLFTECYDNLQEAKKRELYWKSGAGRRKLKQYFQKGFPPID